MVTFTPKHVAGMHVRGQVELIEFGRNRIDSNGALIDVKLCEQAFQTVRSNEVFDTVNQIGAVL